MEKTIEEPNISVYRDNEESIDDFPVLKAFQQYIDAEQEKARKRMTVLSIVFAATLTAVVAVFMWRLSDVGRRNQELFDRMAERNQQLNDRLVEYAMQDRQTVAPATMLDNSAAIKSMTETITALQHQLLEQQRVTAAAMQEQAKPSAVPSDELMRKNRANAEKLRKAAAALKAERQRIKQEKELLKQAQIEQYRRKNYPQYFSNLPVAKDPLLHEDDALMKNLADEVDESENSAIEYFDSSDDEYAVPVEVNGKKTLWTIPKVETTTDNAGGESAVD